MGKKSKKKELRKVNPKVVSKAKPSTSFWKSNKRILTIGAILVFTFFVYSSNLGHEFVNWDDDRNFYENPLITSLNGENFWTNTKEIFQTSVIGGYNPLSIWTFAIEHQIYGLDNPGMWHLTNILLHLICVLLVFRLSHYLGLDRWGALLVTLLFAIHPMRVESVAWVTERKDVLYGAFYLAALVYYAKHRQHPSAKFLMSIIILFTLSLFSKIQAVILPMSMLCIDYLLDKQITFKHIYSKWFYFAMSLLFGILGIVFLKDEGTLDSATAYAFWERLFIGSYSYTIYLFKWLLPYEMSPLYPYPPSLKWFHFASMIAAPLTIGGLYWAWKKEYKPIVFGWCFFIFNVIFLLQILGAGQGYKADRFTYIAYFGLFFILGWMFDKILIKYQAKQTLILGVAGFYIGSLTFINVKQNLIWKNSDTMWSHVLKYYDKTTLPYGNRANYLRDNGQTKRAINDYNMAIKLQEKSPQAYNSRAKLFFNTGGNRDTLLMALNDYTKAIEYKPDDGEFYVNRGATYARLGMMDKALEDINKGITLKPDHAVGYLNRSVMYNNKGDMARALEDINSYLKLKPYHADMWYEKGRAMRQLNQVKASIGAFDRAIQLNSGKSLYYYERGRTYNVLGDKNSARADLQRAIEMGQQNIDPAFRSDLGL